MCQKVILSISNIILVLKFLCYYSARSLILGLIIFETELTFMPAIEPYVEGSDWGKFCIDYIFT